MDRKWTLKEKRNRQDLIEVFKMYRGFSTISIHKLFVLDTNSKATKGHILYTIHANYYFFQQIGICWTSRRWMHPASMHLSLDCAVSWTTGWLFHGLVCWALDLAGCIICQWGCTKYTTRYIKNLQPILLTICFHKRTSLRNSHPPYFKSLDLKTI